MADRPAIQGAATAVWSDFCAVCPSPELRERLGQEMQRVRGEAGLMSQFTPSGAPRLLGFDDGTIIPPNEFPVGTPSAVIGTAAAARTPLTGAVRVAVVLADFPDKQMTETKEHFEKLFFSIGELPHGSVRDYYREVTHGLVDIVGEVIGPVRLPQKLSWYANNNYGIGRPSGQARANLMARDAAVTADPLINYAPYDNDGNGIVDAFVLVHCGPGGEVTGDPGDIWSHKWVLPTAYNADGARIFPYLTIPEDAKIGVCAHELGHLLFGFPDLYDTDDTSEGIGNWCLMAGGSWGGGGDIPTHPSAWCKLQQGWAKEVNVTSDGTLAIPDVKNSFEVHRLWTDGLQGSEYFLVENRQRTGYDVSLPASGMLVWHVDGSQPDNTNENHYKVGLVQADNQRDLEWAANRGDAGDPYPGNTGNTAFNAESKPNSQSYAGVPTGVSITDISAPGATMTATASVTAPSAVRAPLRAARRPEAEAAPRLVGTIHDIQERLAVLEQAVESYSMASAEAFLERMQPELSAAAAGQKPTPRLYGAHGARRFDIPPHQ
ncbi:M6 family metalloprotease domain-containing protein [Saccharopolyspora shandongensis]|uniref:M6 family metalloprotease domain-containing protein n=1 Tax=Saccharopolyspora shandongensis TaxID=418495 RepID=UPI0034397436